MARRFVTASAQGGTSTFSAGFGRSITMSCWFWHVGDGNLIYLGNAGSSEYMRMRVNLTRLWVESPSSSVAPVTNIPSNRWVHGCAVSRVSAPNYFSVYMDAATVAHETSVNTPANYNLARRFDVGQSTTSLRYSGIIADAAIWAAELTDGEICLLAQGVNPARVRSGSLLAYWPLSTPGVAIERDLNPNAPRRYDLTLAGSPVPAIRPSFLEPIVLPKRRLIAVGGGAAKAKRSTLLGVG